VKNSSLFAAAGTALVVLTYLCVDAHGESVHAALGRAIPRPKDPPEPTESTLLIAQEGENVRVAGAVPSEEIRKSILASIATTFPNRPILDSLVVEVSARERSWVRSVSAMIPVLSSLREGDFMATGEVVKVSGATESDKEAVLGKLRALCNASVVDAIRIRTRKEQTQDAVNYFLDTHVIAFEISSSALTPEGEQVVKEFAAILKREGRGLQLEIEGHTDNSGMVVANRALSLDRANTVRDLLARSGVDAEKITARGYGSDRPIADNSTDEGKKKNRRIEIHVR
jgi:OmpA-OmpF porin, OOP family